MKKVIYPILFLFLSCENEELNFLDAVNDNLTVEAYVEANKKPVIYLTTGLPLNGFKEIDFLKSIESRAKVELFGNGISEIATFSKDNSRFPSRLYTFDNIKGEIGVSYELKITINNDEYISKTMVPKKPVLSSISVVEQSTFEAGVYNLKIDLVNNPDENTYYKFYIKAKDVDKYSKASVFVVSNEFINTPVLTVFNDFFSFDKKGEKSSFLQKGTSYDLKIVSIVKEEFEFWESVFGSQTEIVNLPSLAKEVPTNISNGGFGFFSGNSELITTVTID